MGISGKDELADVPQSDINKEYYWNQKREAITDGVHNPQLDARRRGDVRASYDRTRPVYSLLREESCQALLLLDQGILHQGHVGRLPVQALLRRLPLS